MAGRALQFLRYTWGPSYLPRDTTSFVIVGLSRTGSNLIAAMLDSHPDIICHHEVFNAGEIHRSMRYKGTDLSFGTLAERDRDPWAFAARLFAHSDGARAVGFKLLSRQNTPLLVSLLLNRRVRKIILHRRQWLEQYVSQRVAEKTNVWSNMGGERGEETRELVRVRVEPEDLLHFIRKRETFYRGVGALTRSTFQPVIRVAYEDLTLPDTARSILEFLGVNPEVPLRQKTRKQENTSLPMRIENYEELRQKLATTRYSYLVESN